MDTGKAGYSIVWTYLVHAQYQAEFEAVYESDGDWAKLFQRDPGYTGTMLQRDDQNPLRYITIDYWLTKEAYEQFLETWQTEYQALDARCEGWTQTESLIGKFQSID